MESEIYDDLALEQIAKSKFGLALEINHVVLRNVPVSRAATATVFLTKKKQLYVYISGQSRMILSDVRKIVNRMGCEPELFLPPKGQPSYFDEVGKEKFRAVFPGRSNPGADDIRYYRTLAPYNPALVQVREIKNGELYQYDADSKSGWRLGAKFAYRRIKTS